MNISPVNYQMEMMQSYSLKQNNSINFKCKREYIAPTMTMLKKNLVRNKRTYYPKDNQPLLKDLLEQYTKFFARIEKKKYNACGDVKTVYYDAENKIMATVYDVQSMGKHNHLTLKTKDKDFHSFNKDGIVECYDEDALRPVCEELPLKFSYQLPSHGPRPFEGRI